jgi:hypothetical protein
MHEKITHSPDVLGSEEFFAQFMLQSGSYDTDQITEAAVKELNPMDTESLQKFLEGLSGHLLLSSERHQIETAEQTFNYSSHWPVQWANIVMQSAILKMHADPRTSHYVYGGLGTNLQRWEDAEKAVIARKEREALV